MIRSRGNDIRGVISRLGEMRYVYKMLLVKPEGKSHMGDSDEDGKYENVSWVGSE